MVDNWMWNCCNCYSSLWPWRSNVVKQWKRSWVHSVINSLWWSQYTVSYRAFQFILWSHHVHCRRPDYSTQLLQWECTRKYSGVFTCSINQTLFPDTRQLSSLYPQQSHQFYESWAFSLVFTRPVTDVMQWHYDTTGTGFEPQSLFSWTGWYKV